VFLWKQKVPGAATNATIQCRANLVQLHGALEQWALEYNKPCGDNVQIPPLVMYLKGGMAPACPSGGKYFFTVVSNFPCCTVTGHTIR